MYVYSDDKGNIVAASEERLELSEFGYTEKKTNKELVQINGVLHYKTQAKELLEQESLKEERYELLTFLESTDYVAIKIAEGAATAEEYAEVLQKRREARARINELGG